jgi:hypothetical protein
MLRVIRPDFEVDHSALTGGVNIPINKECSTKPYAVINPETVLENSGGYFFAMV